MNKEAKKVEETEQEPKPVEVSEQDLDEVAGGGSSDVGGIDIVVKRKPTRQGA